MRNFCTCIRSDAITRVLASLGLVLAMGSVAGAQCPGDGDCCADNGTPGCSDAACCEIVCAADPFCCETAWDGICADGAQQMCGDLCGGPPPPAGCDEDINGDGVVDVEDLVIVILDWGCGQGGPGCPGEGNCCEPNGTPGCDDAGCCETVCAADPFCCDIEWDGICADGAAKLCGDLCDGPPPPGGCGDKGAGNCCEANGTPACDEITCCELVCGQDPFCCETEWDQICADAAQGQCKICNGPPPEGCGGQAAGSCCEPNGSPFCDDLACCEIVCGADPFCCETEWDQICADAAAKLCGDLCGGPPPPASDCCQPNATPGCSDPECEALICGQDPFCCDIQWDGICADAANTQCAVCQGGAGDGGGDCIGDVTGDGQTDVEDLVAIILAWGPCEQGGACPGDGGDCCEANGSPGCDDAGCCTLICEIDPFCCDAAWDQLCADAAARLCGDLCGGPPPGGCPGDGDCCIDNGTPGCDDAACCELICGQDPFCCDIAWDGICADAANAQCEGCDGPPPPPGVCGPGNGDCFIDNGTPGCDDASCCETVCAIDPFCCDVAWDGICADEAAQFCDPSGGCPGEGSCFEANGTPGCSDEACCTIVCEQNPFCCDVAWDAECAAQAAKFCS